MKNKELVEKLSGLNPEAEVGYEYQTIARAHEDTSGEYIDLSGERHVDKDKIDSTGVFVLVSEYEEVKKEDTDGCENCKRGTEINAVFSNKKEAEKMGKWLLKSSEEMRRENRWSWEVDDENNVYARRYLSYKIENFLILG